MPKKKIIAFIDWYLPGYKAGGGQRAFANMVSYLRDTFDFYIITRNTDFLESTPYEGIESNKWFSLNEGENVYYCTEEKIGKDLYKQLIEEVKPDYAYINGVYSWKFSILPLIILKQIGFKGKKVLGTYGMLAPTAINIKKRKKKFFIKLSKLTGLYNNVLFHTTSEKETDDVKNALGSKVKVQMAPHLPLKVLPEHNMTEKKRGYLKLISIARISPEKNTLYALESLMDLSGFEGQIYYDLYGPIYDQLYWKECQELIKQLPENINVNYKGVVDGNKVLDLFMRYHALFMPTRGENFGYVILESFMAGRPVLISDQTPWRQLENAKCGWDLDLNRSTDYKSALKELINIGQEEFDLLCEGARRRAERFINDSGLKEGNVALFV
nr:glycosyltransferase [uncultured Carboxylicivirga sp.]